ncbi:unnamed protein product [Notodromas monacha]|uniref:Cyclin-like domain-containing protein n=1 Tax=Notodromas monacha TaxID=399045 RepID=A0A7R9BIX1_9CRUS|nr:unnamed protein product [Notodromas monacha]CAG0914772.1 unnamed protein product [Notodromas monacha]
MEKEELVSRPYGKIVLSLDNVLLPPEKTATSPSHEDGLDEKSEFELRFVACELIQTAGILLKVPQVAMASGQVLFQRFYYSKSLVRLPMEHTAMAALCLASKIEEAPRRIRDIINVFHHIRQVRAGKKISPLVLDTNYIALKNQVIKAERRILKELGFCVHVQHPHKLIVTYLNLLGAKKNTRLMQLAWNYMNDSLRSDVFVRFTPNAIACACIALAARREGVPLPKNPRPWFELFDVTTSDVHDISVSLLKLYRIEKPDLEKLERKVADLDKSLKDAKLKARLAAGGTLSAGNTPLGAGGSGALSPQLPFSNNASPSTANKENRASSVTVVNVIDDTKRRKDEPVANGVEEVKRRSRSRSRSPSRKRRRRSSSDKRRKHQNGARDSSTSSSTSGSSSEGEDSPRGKKKSDGSRRNRRKEKRRHRSRHRHHRRDQHARSRRRVKKGKARSQSPSVSPRRRDDKRGRSKTDKRAK